MLHVHYDHQVFSNFRKGGVVRYFDELIHALNLREDTQCRVHSKFVSADTFERLRGVKGMEARKRPEFKGSVRVFDLINRVSFKRAINKVSELDVLHQTYHSPVNFKHPKVPKVQTIHDLIHEHFLGDSLHKRRAVEAADHFICVSESTRNDFLDHYNVPEEQVTTVLHGFYGFSDVDPDLSVLPGRPFFLFVGRPYGYKNFDRLLDAFAKNKDLVDKAQIFVATSSPVSDDLRRRIRDLGLQPDSVIFCPVSDSGLRALYEGALALVYPSKYEGFGFPLLEAMSLGCPVISSNQSSLPEVGGDVPYYFNPDNTQELEDHLLEFVRDDKRASDRIHQGRERTKQFSWELCAAKTRSVYSSLA